TNISIFNKGIMIKNNVINVGSYYVDHDLAYIYNISLEKARDLKENFAISSSRYADMYDKI
ncbi:MAG: cell division FtsA domain-containing protein, partial [Bacilli bacterium]|nr:cell division FtsA domain-containing protein [Bacilli bacterium]